MPVKLLFVIPHFKAGAGGAEAYVISVARKLLARGHQVAVAAQDGQPMQNLQLFCGNFPEVVERARVAFTPDLVIDWGLNVPADIHRLGGGVHTQFLKYNLASCGGLQRLCKTALLPMSFKHKRIAAHEMRLLRKPGTHLLAVSHFVEKQVKQVVPHADVTVLHNGVDVKRFSAAEFQAERDTIRKELGLAAENVACLFVAHNLRLKNLALLEAIFPVLATACPSLRLVLLGKRRPAKMYPWLLYAGSQRLPERIYAACDILLHPTFYDACANVVLEALASGLPVISSNCNGSAELLDPGRSGFVLPVNGDQQGICREWADTILQLASAPQLRQQMGEAARASALKHSIDNYVDHFEDFLSSCAPRGERL